jgi:hypothetical protein
MQQAASSPQQTLKPKTSSLQLRNNPITTINPKPSLPESRGCWNAAGRAATK